MSHSTTSDNQPHAIQGLAEAPSHSQQKMFGFEFILLWTSETLFDLGAAIAGFALGVWVFSTTGSAEAFSYAVIFAAIPALLMTPIAGTLADCYNRRLVIICCDIALTLSTLVLTLMILYKYHSLWHLYLFSALSSAINAIRTPAFKASVARVVHRDRLTQASGLIGMSQAALQIFAPLTAGYLMASSGLVGIMLIEVSLMSAGTIAAFSALSSIGAMAFAARTADSFSIKGRIILSFSLVSNYFRRVPLMLLLLAYGVLLDGLLVLSTTMVTPMVLSSYSSADLGIVLTSGSIGGLLGSGLLLMVKVAKRLMVWILVTNCLLSLFLFFAGLSTSLALLCVCAFGGMWSGSVATACSMALWMRKAPLAQQGSIFAVTSALNLITVCSVLLAGAYVGEHVFEPALSTGGEWAGSIGPWLGIGPGRGYALLFLACGAAGTLVSGMALAHRSFRRLDLLVADHNAN